jgi:hypothetical protein
MFTYEIFNILNNSKFNNNEKIIRITNNRIIIKYDEDVFYIYVDYFNSMVELINIISISGDKNRIIKNISISNTFDKLVFLSDTEIIIYDINKIIKNKILKIITNIPHELKSINDVLSVYVSDKYVFVKCIGFVNIYDIFNNKYLTFITTNECYINSNGMICEFINKNLLKINYISDNDIADKQLEVSHDKNFFKMSSDGKLLITKYDNCLRIVNNSLIYNYKSVKIDTDDILILIDPYINNTKSYLFVLWNTKKFILTYIGLTSDMKILELDKYDLLKNITDDNLKSINSFYYAGTNNKYIFYEYENIYLQINCKFAFDFMSNVVGIIGMKSQIINHILSDMKKEIIVTNNDITKVYKQHPFIVNMFNGKIIFKEYAIFEEQIFDNAQLIDVIFALLFDPVKHLYTDDDMINVLNDTNKLLPLVDILYDLMKNIIDEKYKIYYKLVFRQFILIIIKSEYLQNDIKKLKKILNNI